EWERGVGNYRSRDRAAGAIIQPSRYGDGESIRRPPAASWRSFVQETGLRNSAYGADRFGFTNLRAIHWNLTAPSLYQHAIAAGEASVVEGGALCAETGVPTGRSPNDKHTVVHSLTTHTVCVGGNRQIAP